MHPALIPQDAPLAKVDGVLNAVEVEGDLVGKVLFHGRGAGSMPTASAMIGDILEAASDIARGTPAANKIPSTEQGVDPQPHCRPGNALLQSAQPYWTAPECWPRCPPFSATSG